MSKDTQSPLVFLQSKRVILRPVLEEDTPALLRWINDPEVNQYLLTYLPQMEGDQREWIERVRKRKSNDITLVIVADNKPIGTMGLHRIEWVNRVATTGALIGEKEYWGKGYGSEAKMLFLDYAFNRLNLRKIYSDVIAFNKRSVRYSLKCGYKKEARLKKRHFRFGKYWDEVLLSVKRKDWLPLWKKFTKKHGLKIPKK